MVEVGDVAPDFTLRDQHGQEVTLSSYRGEKNVVVMFYPLSFTPTCQGEMCAVRDDLERFQNDTTQLLTVSVDSPAAHRAWARDQGYAFPLLSDFWPHGAVATSYGVFDAVAGLAVRGTFVVDRTGVVRWKVVNAVPDARDQRDYVAALAALPA